jgi:hypothetical protein
MSKKFLQNIFIYLTVPTTCLLTYLLTYLLLTYLHVLTYLLTYLLHGATVLLETPTGFKLLKEFAVFYRTRRFITAFTSVRHLNLSCTSSIQAVTPHPTTWRSILILPSYLFLGLPSCLFLSGFLTETLYKPLLFPIRSTCLPISLF